MRHHHRRGVFLLTAVLAPWLVAACGPDLREPIVIEERAVRVTNTTDEPWRDVQVWVNQHYRVTAAALQPGGRFVAPLDTFVAGFGQRFDPRRQSVDSAWVQAKDAQGSDVRFEWRKR